MQANQVFELSAGIFVCTLVILGLIAKGLGFLNGGPKE